MGERMEWIREVDRAVRAKPGHENDLVSGVVMSLSRPGGLDTLAMILENPDGEYTVGILQGRDSPEMPRNSEAVMTKAMRFLMPTRGDGTLWQSVGDLDQRLATGEDIDQIVPGLENIQGALIYYTAVMIGRAAEAIDDDGLREMLAAGRERFGIGTPERIVLGMGFQHTGVSNGHAVWHHEYLALIAGEDDETAQWFTVFVIGIDTDPLFVVTSELHDGDVSADELFGRTAEWHHEVFEAVAEGMAAGLTKPDEGAAGSGAGANLSDPMELLRRYRRGESPFSMN